MPTLCHPRRLAAFFPLLALLVARAEPASAQGTPSGGGKAAGSGQLAGVRGGTQVVFEFEWLANGKALQGDEFEKFFTLASWGPNAGLALFDSTIGGPNDGGRDPDLIVGKGNLLILQDDTSTALSAPGIYAVPNDDKHGGTVRFELATEASPVSIDLIDADASGGMVLVTLTDAQGALRIYEVPAGYTTDIHAEGPPGFGTLSLQTLAPQQGYAGVATAVEQAGFDASSVVALEISCTASLGLDRLVLNLSTAGCELPQRSYPVSDLNDVAGADVDGDGAVDLVVPDSGADHVLVHLNDGHGAFLPAVAYPTAAGPDGIAIADLDRDGALDLAVVGGLSTAAEGSQSAVSILLNQGGGVFGPQAQYALPEVAESIVAADFDGDGSVDVATGPRSQFSGKDIYVLLNQGDGTLGPPAAVPTGEDPNHRRVLTADFDSDGSPDLALPKHADSHVEVWLNAGDGAFGALSEHPVGGNANDGTSADLDHDGDPDLAVGLHSQKKVSFLKNLGGGNFAQPKTYDTGGASYMVVALDADLDFDLDLAVGTSQGLVLLRNGGVLTFQPLGTFAPWTTYGTVNGTNALARADVDADGAVDLLVGDSSSGAQVVRNRGDGSFHVRAAFPCGGRPEDLTLADQDGDGELDAATANADDNTVSVLLGHGDGTLGAPVAYPVAVRPLALAQVDLDGDGAPDLAAVCSLGDAVSVLLSQGGTLGPHVPYGTGDNPSSLTAGDWDGDGFVDLAVGRTGSTDGVGLHRNAGDGSFLPPVTLVLGSPRSVVHGDLDLDGDLDLAVSSTQSDQVVIYANQGGGIFAVSAQLPAGSDPKTLHAADWNGDAALDLAYGTSSGKVEVRLNLGDGLFGPLAVYASPADGIDSADRDGDGDLELFAAAGNDGVLSIFENLGGGTFGAREDHATGMSPMQVAAADLDGDGRLDLSSPSITGDSVSVLLTECK